MSEDHSQQQRLVDSLQAALLSAQRLVVTAKDQHDDAAACLRAIERAIAEVKGGAQ